MAGMDENPYQSPETIDELPPLRRRDWIVANVALAIGLALFGGGLYGGEAMLIVYGVVTAFGGGVGVLMQILGYRPDGTPPRPEGKAFDDEPR